MTDEEYYNARKAQTLAPLEEQTYGSLCAPVNGRERRTGILRVAASDVHLPGGLAPDDAAEGDRTMNVVVAIVAAIAIAWIVVIAMLIG
jgi:hypothetical protein